jgi:hypothetical protein
MPTFSEISSKKEEYEDVQWSHTPLSRKIWDQKFAEHFTNCETCSHLSWTQRKGCFPASNASFQCKMIHVGASFHISSVYMYNSWFLYNRKLQKLPTLASPFVCPYVLGRELQSGVLPYFISDT